MDINILLGRQEFRNGAGAFLESITLGVDTVSEKGV